MNTEKETEASQRFQTDLPLMHEIPVFDNVEDMDSSINLLAN